MSNEKLLITNHEGVRKFFEKSEKDVKSDIKILRDWIKNQPHLPEAPNDNVLEFLLVTNKFSVERAKQKLDMYYTIRTLIPELYENYKPSSPSIQEAYKMGIFVPLPKLTEQLQRVFVMKYTGSPDDFDTYKYFSYCLAVMEVRMQHDISVGDVYVVDYRNLKMGHVVKMTPAHLKKAVTVSEKVLSNRIKGIHFINFPTYVDVLINILKPILKPKIVARIHLHNSIEDLYKHIPKAILPKDYGGEDLSMEELNDLWKANLKDHADVFDKLEKMKVKEELRPTPLQNDEVLGYHGNFKKLDVD